MAQELIGGTRNYGIMPAKLQKRSVYDKKRWDDLSEVDKQVYWMLKGTFETKKDLMDKGGVSEAKLKSILAHLDACEGIVLWEEKSGTSIEVGIL